tara:strand:+ start:2193 stop:2783 length:591 start_codon:yes stop_codon:yes gene_type:complete
MEKYKRETAFKITLNDIKSAPYIEQEGWTPNFLEVAGEKIARINIMATVIAVEQETSYISLRLDDSTTILDVRFFEMQQKATTIQPGNTVLIIGKPRSYGNERYVVGEAISIIDPLWLKVRRSELALAPPPAPPPPDTKEEKIDTFTVIKNLDQGQGVSIENLVQEQGPEIEKQIDILLKKGEIFEIKPGVVKVLE